MTIRDRMKAGREKAFKKLDSMAVDVVFNSNDAISYNYGTGITTHTPTVVKTTRAFMIPVEEEMGSNNERSSGSASNNPIHTGLSQLIVRTEDLVATSYTTATINGVVYHCRKSQENILITILELSDVQ